MSMLHCNVGMCVNLIAPLQSKIQRATLAEASALRARQRRVSYLTIVTLNTLLLKNHNFNSKQLLNNLQKYQDDTLSLNTLATGEEDGEMEQFVT